MKFVPPLLACATALLLAGCGQTGPLHLPDDAPAKEGYLLKKRSAPPATKNDPAPVPAAAAPVAPPENPGIEPR